MDALSFFYRCNWPHAKFCVNVLESTSAKTDSAAAEVTTVKMNPETSVASTSRLVASFVSVAEGESVIPPAAVTVRIW